MYVELLSKTNFSFLTGASHPDELMTEAAKLGLKGLGINDVNGMYGVARAYKAQREFTDFRMLVGCEFTLSDGLPLVCLAQSRKGYGDLCRLLSISHAGKPKGLASLSFQEFCAFLENSHDVIVLKRIVHTQDQDFDKQVGVLKDIFKKNFYLVLTRYLDGFDKVRSHKAKTYQQRFSVPIVASNDVYYHVKQRKALQDVLISIREKKTLDEAGGKLFSNAERHIKSFSKMQKLFADEPKSLDLTLDIASSCHFSLTELKYRYPSEWIPQGHTAQSYLEHLIWKNVPTFYPHELPAPVKSQLLHELQMISELGYADYFLTIYDIVEFAKKKQILCQGRGSAANSILCFILGITAINPIDMNLLFERFISSERNEPPDIDVDFEHERREEVIQYIYQKYGRDRAAMVSAVITYRYRSAFREVCKAFGVPVGTLSAKKVEREFDELIKGFEKPEELKTQIADIASQIQGFPRHLSIHSGGFTLSADPILEIVPVEPARMEGRSIIQWDKYDLDTLGLLKVDVLSLGMLSALRKTLDLVGKKLYEIPSDDPKTYKMIQNRETVGVFQIESRAQMQMLGRLLPENFYDLVIEVAIVRPGPIVGQMIHPYLKRRRGLRKFLSPTKNLIGFLEKPKAFLCIKSIT